MFQFSLYLVDGHRLNDYVAAVPRTLARHHLVITA